MNALLLHLIIGIEQIGTYDVLTISWKT